MPAKKKTIRKSVAPKTVTKATPEKAILTRKISKKKRILTAEGWKMMKFRELDKTMVKKKKK